MPEIGWLRFSVSFRSNDCRSLSLIRDPEVKGTPPSMAWWGNRRDHGSTAEIAFLRARPRALSQ